MTIRHLTYLLAMALLAGCASDEIEYTEAEKQYEAAKERIDKGEYNMAAYELEKFSAKFPYSTYAAKGELLRIFAAYRGGEFILSEMLSESFVDRHPTHPHVDYAKYMLAMSHYKQRGSEEHDPLHNKKAIEGFERLIREHPLSEYAKDGQSRLQNLYNALAAHELSVGKFYFDRERYVAAANRFQKIVKEYQTTASIEESLYYLAASYAEMGLSKDARQMAILLRHNYPNSDWSSRVEEFL